MIDLQAGRRWDSSLLVTLSRIDWKVKSARLYLSSYAEAAVRRSTLGNDMRGLDVLICEALTDERDYSALRGDLMLARF